MALPQRASPQSPQIAERIPSIIPESATVAVPAPVGGWNARDSLDNMDPTDAVSLINHFPAFGKVSRRKGYNAHANALAGPVQSHVDYNAESIRKMLARINDKIFVANAAEEVAAA